MGYGGEGEDGRLHGEGLAYGKAGGSVCGLFLLLG